MATLGERIKRTEKILPIEEIQRIEKGNFPQTSDIKSRVSLPKIADITEYPSKMADTLKLEVAKKIATIPVWFDYSKDEQIQLVHSFLNTVFESEEFSSDMQKNEKELLLKDFTRYVRGLGALDFITELDNLQTLMVNSPSDISGIICGNPQTFNLNFNKTHFEELIRTLSQKSLSTSSILTFKDFGRIITLMKEPICSSRLVIKKTGKFYENLQDMLEASIITKKTSNFILNALKEQKKILIKTQKDVCGDYLFYSLIKEFEGQRILLQTSEFLGNFGENVMKFNVCNLSENEQNIFTDTIFQYGANVIFADELSANFTEKLLTKLPSEIGFTALTSDCCNRIRENDFDIIINLTSNGLNYTVNGQV